MIDNRDEGLLHRQIIWSPWGDGPEGLYNPIRVTDRDSGREWQRGPAETIVDFRWRIYDELVSDNLLPVAGDFPLTLVMHHGAEVFSLRDRTRSAFKMESN